MKEKVGSIYRNISITSIVNLLTVMLGAISSVLAARLLGPQGRGELAAAMQWPTVIASLGTLGITVAVAYYCGHKRSQSGEYYTSGLLILMLLTVPCMIIGYLCMPYLLAAQNAQVIFIARSYLFIIPISFMGGLPNMALQGLEEFKAWNLFRFIPSSLWLIIWAYVWYSGKTGIELITGIHLLLMYCLIFPLQAIVIRKLQPPLRPRMSKFSDLVNYGIPTTFTTFPQLMNYQLDQLVMAAFLGSDKLGFYAVAVSWGIIFTPLLQAIGQIVFPRLAFLNDDSRRVELICSAVHLSVLIGTLLVILVLPITPISIILIFGRDYSEAVAPAMILIPASMVRSMNFVLGDILRGLGKPKLPMYSEVAGFISTLALLSFLLPLLGLIGAAIASIVSYSLTFSINLILLKGETRQTVRAILTPSKDDVLLIKKKIVEDYKKWKK